MPTEERRPKTRTATGPRLRRTKRYLAKSDTTACEIHLLETGHGQR